MADFARIKDQDVWINLDYVVRIERGGDEDDTATITFADGSTFRISDADSKRLVKQVLPPKKKKKKKKKGAPSEAAAPEGRAVEGHPPVPADE